MTDDAADPDRALQDAIGAIMEDLLPDGIPEPPAPTRATVQAAMDRFFDAIHADEERLRDPLIAIMPADLADGPDALTRLQARLEEQTGRAVCVLQSQFVPNGSVVLIDPATFDDMTRAELLAQFTKGTAWAPL